MKKATGLKLCLGAALILIVLILDVFSAQTQHPETADENSGKIVAETQQRRQENTRNRFDNQSREFLRMISSARMSRDIHESDAESSLLPDTIEKQMVMRIVIETTEDMKQALSRRDLPHLLRVIETIEGGQVEALEYELPLLRAAGDCIESPSQEKKVNAERALQNSPSSSIKKWVRRICQTG